MEDPMPLAPLVAIFASLVLLLHISPSWGQVPNPTASDGHGNTAGGTGALLNADETASGAFSNTAFGFNAINLDTTGDSNTAIGRGALGSNTTAQGTLPAARARSSTTPPAPTTRRAA